MTRRRAARTRLPRSPKPGSVLERLEADEAHAVLHHLLTPHPDLRTEAEQAARSLLSQVSFESVADDVVNMLVLVHARPTANAQPRPPLEESYRRHEGLIAELAPRARATGLPVAWHALWRLRPQ